MIKKYTNCLCSRYLLTFLEVNHCLLFELQLLKIISCFAAHYIKDLDNHFYNYGNT